MKKYILLCMMLVATACLLAQPVTLTNLRCEYRINPLGIDVPQPRLSWELASPKRGVLQTAYRIVLSKDSAALSAGKALVWDGGKKNSRQSIHVAYTGVPLQPATTYYWRVQVWDQQQHVSQWSSINHFTTGLYKPADWKNAQWIGYETLPDSLLLTPGQQEEGQRLGNKGLQRPVTPLFRKSFTVKKKIVQALAFISGLGQYEMSLNGQPVSAGFLTPGWTYYDKTCLYNTYDVTAGLVKGENAIGVIVGNGFHNINRERYRKLVIAFGMPRMICLLKIAYADGSHETLVSGSDWKTAPSPIVFTSIFGGEDYDARLEQPGWNEAGFKDDGWKNALPVKAPQGRLTAEADYPVQVQEIMRDATITESAPGSFLYDFGQNASGIIELKVKGQPGQTIKLTPAELINSRRQPNQRATGGPYYYSYTIKSTAPEIWRPRFTYYGFRYVQVEGATPDTASGDSIAQLLSISMLHTRNSAPVNGTFTCSNDLFNRTFNLISWAIKSNLQSVVTDCPHREKLSWLEQDYLMGGSIHYNYDIYGLYRKLVHDMMDAQTPEGLVPDIAPEFARFSGGFFDSPEWGSASVILPWLLYNWYGDVQTMQAAYPMMKQYVAYLQGKANNHILSYGLGDWYDYGPKEPGVAQLTPKAVTATTIYYYDITLLAKMALLLQDKAEAARLQALASQVKAAFNKAFFNAATLVYSTGSQTAMSMPLCVGLVEEPYRAGVQQQLLQSIEQSGKALTAGDIGFHFLVKALDEGNASQMIYDMNDRDDVPGYGYQLKKGATSLTESWQALEQVSNNHLMLGHIMEWFYNGLAGISAADGAVAFNKILIRPHPVGNITFTKGSFHSPYGLVSSEWTKSGKLFTLSIHIPANTTATVQLPATATAVITEGGKAMGSGADVKLMSQQAGLAVVQVGSGNYLFEVKQ